jgi:hypothetical protein
MSRLLLLVINSIINITLDPEKNVFQQPIDYNIRTRLVLYSYVLVFGIHIKNLKKHSKLISYKRILLYQCQNILTCGYFNI